MVSSTQEPPASGRLPSLRLTQRDVQTSADELIGFHRLFQSVFQQREWSLFYLCGQLVNLPRKTMERMVLYFRGADLTAIRALQQFISQSTWLAVKLILRQQELAADWLGDPQGVVIVDGSGFPKQGQDSVGKVTNAQEGVFLVYVSHHGNAFLDARLYLHESWFADEQEKRPAVLSVIAYRQQRNYAAYCSHRRRALKQKR